MEEMLKDKRFAHIAKDPKFRRIPKSERKVKIDKRFQAMFTDKKFSIKYTVDKRGRPVNQTSTEDLKKYYDISSDEEGSSNTESSAKNNETEIKKSKKNIKLGTVDHTKNAENKLIDINKNEDEESEGDENFSSNGSLLLIKQSTNDSSENDEDSDRETSDQNKLQENENQLKIKRANELNLDDNTKKKLRDLTIDYARGEGVLFSDSSSGEESSDYESNEDEIEHKWGELDKEAETTEKITRRLAICNMDWDRIKASDLMVLFNSFLPTGGLIHNVTIYPSEFGLQRMKEEEVKGPIELTKPKQKNADDGSDSEEEDKRDDDEDSDFHMEKVRQYQLNRLKYYYAVVTFDSNSTANKIYTECDGLEYESSSTKIDLRFIPDDMTFDQEPKEICDKLPDLTKYQPRQFTTTALQQVKVDLTWDETDPERQEITQKLNSGKYDELNQNDLQAYVASGSSEDESEDPVKKKLECINGEDKLITDSEQINKWRSLLEDMKQEEEAKKNDGIDMQVTWGIGSKDKAEKLVKEKLKKKENLSSFEEYLEKRKAKKKAKRDQKKNLSQDDENKSGSEDSIPSDIDMNDPYFAEELVNTKAKSKKRKNVSKTSNKDLSDEEDQKKKQAELELLLMNDEGENKHHFSMDRIEKGESLTKSKKKRLSKKKKDLKEEAGKDDFEVDVQDSRFNAIFTSHHYNIDPADPHYRKTKGTEALINEKLKRRRKNDSDLNIEQESSVERKNTEEPKVDAELNSLIKSVKRKTQNLNKQNRYY